MSAAPAATADAAPAAKGGKKKLIIIIIAAVLLLVLVGGGAAFFLLKKAPADGEEGADDGGHGKAATHAPAPKAAVRREPGAPPVFVPLDPFTVNLADRESERYAQIGLTLEIDDAKTGEELKLYMPAIRNNILMVLSHKTAAQLLTREGKDKLAQSILYASVRPLGYEIDEEEEEPEEDADAPVKPKKKKKKKAPPVLPVVAVHFSNFIVQ
ncbi:MAG: flagellar basal body rod protein [Burkholderiales bacterium RIFCSPHIGHO2_12_FULL_69_20]|nr:MAG: flagellar basal body rod protein [Burkholderiales bacterium RIFCSPHIGHO2_12_FULL_69_20]